MHVSPLTEWFNVCNQIKGKSLKQSNFISLTLWLLNQGSAKVMTPKVCLWLISYSSIKFSKLK